MNEPDAVKLTKNQALVFDVLRSAPSSLSAYAILDDLRDQGLRAPLQVYRALEKLVDLGLVHRLESLNAFIACQHASCSEKGTAVFAICNTCGDVAELADATLTKQVEVRASQDGFRLDKSTIELHGECKDCSAD